MATTSYGTPYVQSSDLVSGWPNASLNVANRIDEVSYAGNGINAQTVTSYTLAVTDAGKLVTLNNAAAVAVSLPQDSTANLPVGSVIRIYNLGAGLVTVQAGSGATLQGGSVTVAQYGACDVTKLSANTYGISATSVVGMVPITPTSVVNGTASGAQVTFTAQTTVSLNGIFTSTYDNYRLVIDFTSSGTGRVSSRLRVAGTDNSTASSYADQLLSVNNTVLTAGRTTTDKWDDFFSMNSTRRNAYSVDIYAPALAQPTQFSLIGNYSNTEAAALFVTGSHNQSTAYDGLTIFPNTGNITGIIRVYGYKNS